MKKSVSFILIVAFLLSVVPVVSVYAASIEMEETGHLNIQAVPGVCNKGTVDWYAIILGKSGTMHGNSTKIAGTENGFELTISVEVTKSIKGSIIQVFFGEFGSLTRMYYSLDGPVGSDSKLEVYELNNSLHYLSVKVTTNATSFSQKIYIDHFEEDLPPIEQTVTFAPPEEAYQSYNLSVRLNSEEAEEIRLTDLWNESEEERSFSNVTSAYLEKAPESFLGWCMTDLESGKTVYSVVRDLLELPESGMFCVTPIFRSGLDRKRSATWRVGENTTTYFDEAIAWAIDSPETPVILQSSGELTLQLGREVTVPENVSVVIPPEIETQRLAKSGSVTGPAVYELYIDDISVHCNGTWSIGGEGIDGAYSNVYIDPRSELILSSGANLTCFGYILGGGTVQVLPGATVTELLVLYEDSYSIPNIRATTEYFGGCTLLGRVECGEKSSELKLLGSSDAVICMASESRLESWFERSKEDSSLGTTHLMLNGSFSFGTPAVSEDTSIVSYEQIRSLPADWEVFLQSGEILVDQPMMQSAGSKIIISENAVMTVKDRLTVVQEENGVADLIVDGTLVLSDGSAFGGLIQTDGTGTLVVSEGAILSVDIEDETLDAELYFGNGEDAFFTPAVGTTYYGRDLQDGVEVPPTLGASEEPLASGAWYCTAWEYRTDATHSVFVYSQTGDKPDVSLDTTYPLYHEGFYYEAPVTDWTETEDARGITVCTSEYVVAPVLPANAKKSDFALLDPATKLSGLQIEFRLYDYIWLNARFTLGPGADLNHLDPTVEVYCNGEKSKIDAEIVIVNGAAYLARKMLSTDLMKEFTFVFYYTENGDVLKHYETVSFAEFSLPSNSSSEMQTLLSVMKTYGKASENYFQKGNHTLDLSKDGLTEIHSFAGAAKSVYPETISESGLHIRVESANFAFDEALYLRLDCALSDELTDDRVGKIGLLIGYGGAELSADACDRSVISYDANEGTFDICSTIVYAPLFTDEYLKTLQLRLFVLLDDGTILYSAQYAYSLPQYLATQFFSDSFDRQYRDLLLATWNYIHAANEAFAG